MTIEMWITLAILVIAIVLFVTEWLRVDLVALGVVLALMLTGILTTSEAISGFSSGPVLTIGSLFVIGGAVMQTGLAAMIGNRILRVAGTNETRLIILVMVAAAIMSGFLSDTGVVAVMLPAILGLALSAKLSPSKLLIPLAYGSLLGGATTLIGTPPNIIVSDLLRSEPGLQPFEFFDYTPIGLLLIGAGIIFMLTIGKRLLPDHKPQQEMQQMETPKELFDLYKLPENLYRMRVRSKSPLVGQQLLDARLGTDFNLNVIEIERPIQPREVARIGDQSLVLQRNHRTMLQPNAETSLAIDDVLIVRGEGNDVGRAAGYWNLAIQPAEADTYDKLVSREVGIAEIIIAPRSSVIGKTVRQLTFGSTYRLTVLDIRRTGTTGQLDIKNTPLLSGDTLLVQGLWRDISSMRNRSHDFLVIGEPEAVIRATTRRSKAPLALAALLGMTLLIVLNLLTVTQASMVAAMAVILTGCVTMDEAYDAIDWKSIVLIAGMLPMSTALQNVGLVQLVADGFITTLGDYGPHAVLAGMFLLTSGFTQVLSNTATAVLIAPIGLAIATRLDISPYALLMAVAVAASMAFASPVASPVNTLVMGAGQYRFIDYMKIGVPMIIISLIIVVVALPLLFPF